MQPDYYVLDDDGRPLPCDDVIVWARWFEAADRYIADDTIGDVRISTVFLGLNHNFDDDGAPVLWETLVFGSSLDREMDRYDSREAALAGHAAMVTRVCAALGLGSPLG